MSSVLTYSVVLKSNNNSQWLLTPTDSVNKQQEPPRTIDTARSRELVYTRLVLFRCDNVVFNDRIRLHADGLRGTDEIQDEETI